MARRCDVTGKGPLVGHHVSHSNIKTKRRYLPNVQQVTLFSEVLDRQVRMKVSMHGLRSVEHAGGLDAFLLKCSDDGLSLEARRLKRAIRKASAGAEAEAAAD